MGRFRALLLGVAEYEDPGIPDLPFVVDDLTNVAAALESRGYTVDIPHNDGRLGQIQLKTAVSRFLATARADDTLLIYLSGHGAHSNAVDYLLPTDADLRWLPLADGAVPLTAWTATIERSEATGVFFLVDACRDGFQENAKSVMTRTAWAHEKIMRLARQNVAWLFPCSPGEVAHFVRNAAGGKSFSLFARAVEEAIAGESAAFTLGMFKDAVGAHMAALADDNGLPHQRARLLGEADHDGFIVLPALSNTGGPTNLWAEAVASHVAWQRVNSITGGDRLRDDVISLVCHLEAERHTARERLAADPWHDPQFALRMSERMSFILGSILGDLRLSPAEAALLVATPFVHDLHWASAAADASAIGPANLITDAAPTQDRAAFEGYVRSHPRLLRRAINAAVTGETAAAAQIGWWLLHRWISGQAAAFRSQAIDTLLAGRLPRTGLAVEVLSGDRLSEMIRLLYADPGFIARTDRPHGLVAKVVIATGRFGEQELRERMVAYLLVVAHRLAVEVTRLSSVIVEHVGIPQSVLISAVLRTLNDARWEPRGAGRVLRAACAHPAVEVALREHAAELDRLLTDISNSDDPSLAPLKGLPSHAGADQVHAAQAEAGAVYTSAGIRFHLDEERVQQLLMGENLYDQAELAVREIYQNALDACRYRQARTEYLRRMGTDLPHWQGHIRFAQGIDAQGRPYIDCTDNGIGMGVRELRDVFAQAGVRFAELPEFLEEQAEWAALSPPVTLYPNSQFGIGVLSYFMLADEISVTTCRLDRDCRPGHRLQVSIAGPGTLFHIQDLGPGAEAGTVVRLYLRTTGDSSPVSCTEALENVLWYSEFLVEAMNGADLKVWRPGELRADPTSALFPVPGSPVWWCAGDGAVLADGLRTDETPFGVIVNLTGENMPELSVNRNELLDSPHNKKLLTRVLSEAAYVFARLDGPALSFDWLCEFVQAQPKVADLIFHIAVQGGRTLHLNGWNLDFARLGFFGPDRLLVPPNGAYQRPLYSARGQAQRRETRGAEPLSDYLMRWRLIALYGDPDGMSSTVKARARPSDAMILNTLPHPHYSGVQREHSWLPVDKPVPVGHIIFAAEVTGYPIEVVTRRLADLGFHASTTVSATGTIDSTDAVLVSRDLDGVGPWLEDRDRTGAPIPIPTGHIAAASAQLGRSIGQVAERLAALGFLVPEPLKGKGAAEPADRILLSRDLSGTPPWLDSRDASGEPIVTPKGHIVAAAAQLGRDVGRVAKRLAELGFDVPAGLSRLGMVRADDHALVSINLDARPPVQPGASTVPIGHLLFAAERLGASVTEIARRLGDLGFFLPDLVDRTGPDDLVIVSQNVDGIPPWLSLEGRVHSLHVIEAAESTRSTVREVGRRLAALGFDVPRKLLDAGDLRHGGRLIIDRAPTGEHLYLPQWDADGALIPVPLGHAVIVAERLGCSVSDVARELDQLNFLVPPVLFDIGRPQPGDRVLASRDLTGEWPWLTDGVVPLGHIITAQDRLGLPAEQLADRLRKLGFDANCTGPLTSQDLILTSRELTAPSHPDTMRDRRFDETGWWLDQERPVPMWNVVAGAVATNRSIAEIEEVLHTLGFEVPNITGITEFPAWFHRVRPSGWDMS
ncbi:caspase family protein [Streptosporangiaceae bacterium NEAU-GS5]|nr:caspase family protein [Streptosporangiaceae bacterium NEAU-GS5]